MLTTGVTPKIKLPYPHPGQQEVRRAARRFNWLSAGRRWRKTTLAMAISVEAALTGGTYIWGAPTFDQVRIGFSETKRALGNYADFNLSRMTATLPNAGRIVFRSLDNPDNVRGHTADGVVIDEIGHIKVSAWHEVLRPAFMKSAAWTHAIRPALSDRQGKAIFPSTPKGRGFFWQLYQRGLDDHDTEWSSWNFPTSDNPYIADEEIEAAKQGLPERIFRQEYLAEFLDDAGGVFRRVMDAATATAQEKAIEGHQYVMGVDWGRSNDFTVLTVIDMTTNELVAMDRFTKIDYGIQVNRLKALAQRFNVTQVIAEMNSMGGPLVEQLQSDGLPVKGFMTTNASKEEAIRALEGAFERSEIRILNDPVLVGELQAFEQEQLPAGKYRFNAPEGMHDDTVISLAIAWHSIADSWWIW